MQFLAITRRRIETFSQAQFDEVLGPEGDAVRDAYGRSEIRAIYSRGDVPGAVLLLEQPDVEAAWGFMEALPLARLGMMDVEVVPLAPYRGFV